jgi:hypothetical protein
MLYYKLLYKVFNVWKVRKNDGKSDRTIHYAIIYATTKYTWLYLCYKSQMIDKDVWYNMIP